MCGIAGFVNIKVDKKRVFSSLYHRGPDERGEFLDKNVSLFHTRLSIQDISCGHQPFIYKDYAIVFNGEIYNHQKLREDLKEFSFSTVSDTETLLYLLIKYGISSLEKIDGMFAFAFHDKRRKRLLLARDRVGKKPLFFYKKGDSFAFASELNTLKFLNPTIDNEEIRFFLSTGFCSSPYSEIKELGAGDFLEYEIGNNEVKTKKYFDIYNFYKKDKISSFEEAKYQVEKALEVSVKNRLISSDVEVGAFLSGGIDSSLIVAKASQIKRIKTFTVKFSGSFDESKLARLVAKRYDTIHTEIEIDIEKELKNDIEKILLNYGKPFFDSSAIPSYYVSREARKNVKVILNGDGADELFAGYRRYVPIANGWDKIAKYFKYLLNFLSPNSRGMTMFLYRLIRASNKEGIEWYNVLLNDLFEDIYKFDGKRVDEVDRFIKDIDLKGLDKLLYLDFRLNLAYDLLVKMDIATMANSLEARSPFLSKYFLEIAPRVDNKFKINKTKTKYILRELAKKYLPNELINAPKRGFEIPLVRWINKDLNETVMDYLSYGYYKIFIDEKIVKKIIERKIDISEEKRAKILYLLFSLEVWYNGEKGV